MKYIKKPIEIEAIQFTGTNFAECEQFIGSEYYDNTKNYPNIKINNFTVPVLRGEYIFKTEDGAAGVLSEERFNEDFIPVN